MWSSCRQRARNRPECAERICLGESRGIPAGKCRESRTYLRACWTSLAAFSGPEPPLGLVLILNNLNFFFSPSVSASFSAAPSRLASLRENKPFRDFLDVTFFAISASCWRKTCRGRPNYCGRLSRAGDICSCGSRWCRTWSSGVRTRPLRLCVIGVCALVAFGCFTLEFMGNVTKCIIKFTF